MILAPDDRLYATVSAMSAKRSAWVSSNGQWCHRPWWKVAINTVLRLLQPGKRRKWVIYTVSLTDDNGMPVVLNYGFGRVLHR